MRLLYILFLSLWAYSLHAQIPTSGNVLWLRADANVFNDAAATILATNGLTVAQWNDQSGNAAHAICTPAGYRPTYITNVINGNPVLRFSNHYLQTPNIDLSATDKTDMYVVYKSVTPNTNWEVVAEHGPDYNNYVGFNLFENAQGQTYNGMFAGSSGGGANYKDYPFKTNEFKIVNTSYDKAAAANSKVNLRINSKDILLYDQPAASGSGNFANYPLYIGNRGNAVGSYPLSGDIAEIILYNRKLTGAEKTQIESYLNTKYNIQCAVNNPQPGSGNCLQMGNYGAYAADDADIDFGANDFTVEFWTMKRALSSGGANSACVNKWNTGGSPGTNEWAVATTTDGSNNIPAFFFETGTTYYQANGTTSLTTNKWYHIAAVREGNSIKIYVNGILEGTAAIPPGSAVNNVAARTYMAMGYYPAGSGNNSNLDEVRIWNKALSQNTIRDWMCKKETAIHPDHNNLVRYYRFDEASGTIFGNQVNNCVTEAYSNGGTIVTSGAPIGDNSAYSYTANTATANINFGSPADNFAVSMNAGTSAGVHVYSVNELPNNQNYQGIAGNNKYAGVFVVNGNGTAAYNAAYNYTNNTAVTPIIEPDLKLFKRPDNSSLSWITASGQTLNTGTKTITVTGQNTEYVLANAITPIPPTCAINFSEVAGDGLQVAYNTALNVTTAYTYEAWIKPSIDISNYRCIVSRDAAANTPTIYVSGNADANAGKILVQCVIGGVLKSLYGTITHNDNQWHHIATTYDGTNMVLIVDGIVENAVAVTGTIAVIATPLAIGYNAAAAYHFIGKIDEVRIWNVARTISQISSTMNTSLAGNETGLVLNFDFNNGSFNGNGIVVPNLCSNTGSVLNGLTTGNAANPIFDCPNLSTPPLVAPNCAAKFNGTNSYVDIVNSPATMPTKGTIEFWMNQPSFSDYQIPLATFSPSENAGTFTDGMYFQTYANGNLYFIYASSISVYGIELFGTLTANKSYHVALSWDLTAQKITGYLDGKVIFIKALTTTFPTTLPRFSLGGGFANGRFYNGTLDEVRFWNVERTQSEIINNVSAITGTETGLQAYYHFNENLLNGNGQTVLNKATATGVSLNGTTVNYVKFPCSLAPPTCGISFSGGAGEGVQVPHNAALNNTTAFTYEAWIRPSTNVSNFRAIINKGGNPNYAPGLYINNGSSGTAGVISAYFNIGGSLKQVNSTTTVNDNEWHHVAATYDGATLKVYVDGNLQNSLAAIGILSTNTNPFGIGYNYADNNYPFIGKIDEVRIWNTARTLLELQSAMNVSLAGNESGLQAYYHFNNNDRSGQNRTITNFCTTTGAALNGLTYGTSLTPLFECAPPPFTSPECNLVTNASGDHVVVPNNTALNINSSFTIAAYLKTTDVSGQYKTIIAKSIDANNQNYVMYINPTGRVEVDFQRSPIVTGGAPTVISTSLVNDGNWHYVVGTFDDAADQLKIYVDGALENTVTTIFIPLTGNFPFYMGSAAGSNNYNGSTDEVSIWNRALTASEVTNLIGQSLAGNETGLVAYYNFNGNTKNGQGISVINACTATAAALNGTTVGTAATPTFTCSELTVTAPTCSLLMNGFSDKAFVNGTYAISYPGITQNFTMEVKAKALLPKNNSSGYQYDGVSGQNYVLFPDQAGDGFAAGHAGVGISLGTNGVAVYEHSSNYLPARIAFNNYNTNDWVHLSVVSTNGVLKLYINGALVSTAGASGYILHPSGGIGTYYGAFAGYVGEVRIWNAALSGDQIRTNLNATLTGAETNLVSLYKFGNNTLNGKNKTITGLGSFGSLNPYITSGTDCTPIFTCANTNVVNRDAAVGSGNMISQNGSGISFAELGNTGNIPVQGSIMAWFNATTLKEKAFVFSSSHFRNSTGKYKGINLFTRSDGKLQLTFGTDTTATGYQDTVTVSNNIIGGRWYHFAMSWDTTAKAYTTYINGIQTATGSTNYWPSQFESFKVGIGLQPYALYAWNGQIDELSEWNKILSVTEIRDQLTSKINSSQANYSNLLHYYRFDNNTCNGNAISDYKGTMHGMIYNTSLTTSSAPIGDTSRYDYSGLSSTASVPFGIAGRDTITATITAGSNVQGIHVYGINEKPNTQNGQLILSGNNRYGGVFVAADTNQLAYSMKYSYAINPYVTPSIIQDQLLLYKRLHNADGTWVIDFTAVVDSIAKTYSSIGQNTEYMLGYSPLAVRPHIGLDTTVYIVCDNETFNLVPLYNTTGLTASWNTATPATAGLGNYQLVATSTFGFSDTAIAFVKQDIEVWTGNVSNDWHNTANWNHGKVPTVQTHVIIPAATVNPCQVSNANAFAASVQALTGNFSIINNRNLLISANCATLPVGP